MLLPEDLQGLEDLQEKNGQWSMSPEFARFVGGFVPKPPEGISHWRWATAIVLCYIRRADVPPHLRDRLNDMHDKYSTLQ